MRNRAIVAAALAGLVAIIAVPVLIFQFGRHNPSPPSLQNNPNAAIPGEVLYFDRHGCVVRALASGARAEVATCNVPTNAPSFVTWIDQETIAVAQSWPGPPGERFRVTTINLRTGAEGVATVILRDGTLPYAPSNQVSVHGERVSISESGEVTILVGTEQREIANFDVPRYRGPQFLAWSPDGEWMLLVYYKESNQEIWVLSRDGQTRGTLGKGLRQPVASWFIEGVGVSPRVEVVDGGT